MKKKNFSGILEYDEKTGELTHVEVFFNDYKKNEETEIKADLDPKTLSSSMLKSAFGPSFDPMEGEALSDFPNYDMTGIMPSPF